MKIEDVFNEKNMIWEIISFSKPISNNSGKAVYRKKMISTQSLDDFKRQFGTEILIFGTQPPESPFSNVAICTIFNEHNFNQKADLANFEKHITDVLVKMRILKDDSFKHLKANLQIGEKLAKDVFFQVKIFKIKD
jgi:hypothetical protein